MRVKSASFAILATLLATCALSFDRNDMDRSELSQVKMHDVPRDTMKLAQTGKSRGGWSRKSSKSSSSGDGDGLGFASFIFGCFAIPFALVMLWKNEKKIVTFAKCMDLGKQAVKTVDCDDPDDANEYELVHMTGTSVNAVEIVDNDFGIVAHNSYRLKRKVEMY